MSLIINSSRTMSLKFLLHPEAPAPRSPGQEAAVADEFPGAGTGRFRRPAGAAGPPPWAQLFGGGFWRCPQRWVTRAHSSPCEQLPAEPTPYYLFPSQR